MYRATPKERETARKWYAANREKRLIEKRKRYAANKKKICAANKSWREQDPEREKLRRDTEQKKRQAAFRVKLTTIKRKTGCVDCGRKDGRLDFDHIDPATKLFNISKGTRSEERRVGKQWRSV